jgi:hypothetical protein
MEITGRTYPWRLDGGDEELGAVGVAPGVGHGQEAGGGVLVHEVLIYITVIYRTRPQQFRISPWSGG